jgi:hypothetical protein
MIKRATFVLAIFILGNIYSSSVVANTLLQQAKNANKNAAVIARFSGDVVDISNPTFTANEAVLIELVKQHKNLSDAELKNITSAYSEAADGYCEKLKKVRDEGEVIGANIKRFRCLSQGQYAILVANNIWNACQNRFAFRKQYEKNLRIEEVVLWNGPVSNCRATGKPESYCAEVDKIFQGVNGANCGFIIKSVENYLSEQGNSAEATTISTSQTEVAKKRCIELGMTPSTERFGECVLRMLK